MFIVQSTLFMYERVRRKHVTIREESLKHNLKI